MPGKLFVLDGLDGSGKTTQTALAAEALEKAGHPVKICPISEKRGETPCC